LRRTSTRCGQSLIPRSPGSSARWDFADLLYLFR
jgi:hypothetical protein